MKRDVKSPLRLKQAEFQIRFIWWALGLAIFAGFALGAHVAALIGFNFPLGETFYSYVQTHGHIQLIGWVGLFIIGISLHFIPRLAGVPLAKPHRTNQILGLITSGLTLRFFSHAILPYLTENSWLTPVNWLITISGLLELLGVLLYLKTLLESIRNVTDIKTRPALQSVKPFFLMMMAGWLIYPTLHFILLLQMNLANAITLDQAWNELAVQTFIHLVLLPVAFAFSIRMFPLFLRLPAIDWPVKRIAMTYLISVSLYLLPKLPMLLANLPATLSACGQIAKGLTLLWFVWKLDLLTRRRDPWIVHHKLHPGPERKPTRSGMPDYGEFGRFERLIYSAYIWLVFGAVVDMCVGVAIVVGWHLPISSDTVRHIYLLGFITHLILGMSVRMIPGFLKQKGVARPELVNATFWLGTLAAVCRILPLIIPPFFLELIPGAIVVSQAAFGLSGIFGLAAVICLNVNLRKTARNKHLQIEDGK